MATNPIIRFTSLLKVYRQNVRQVYIYAFFIGLINLTLPIGIQYIINFLYAGEYTSTWFLLVGFVLFGILVSGVLQILQLRVVENIQQDLFARAAFDFAFRLPKIKLLELDKIHAPELVNRFFDTMTLQKGVPKILIDFSLANFQIFLGIILLAVYSPYFIILGLLFAGILWLILRIPANKGLETSGKESKQKYLLVHWLEEVARLNKSFKLYNQHKFHLTKTDDITYNYIKGREKHYKLLVSQYGFFIGFKVFVAAGLLLLGGILVFQGAMNIGQFVAAEIIILLIINSIDKLLYSIDIIYDVMTALDKIGYVTDLEHDTDTGTAIIDTRSGLSVNVREISFGFPDEETTVFDRISFQVDTNEKIILEGKTGSGKSVLLHILSGIIDVNNGEVLINNIPLRNYKKTDFYSNLGVNFSNNQIFEGTIKENILLGRTYPDSKVSEILSLLKFNDFIINQPRGINSWVDSGGSILPSSAIQKIIIARILISEPKLLLIEEPLLHLEPEEKEKIIDFITSPERKWTVIVVSDFEYWKKRCNRVIDLSNV